jgi:hypothetical protein
MLRGRHSDPRDAGGQREERRPGRGLLSLLVTSEVDQCHFQWAPAVWKSAARIPARPIKRTFTADLL